MQAAFMKSFVRSRHVDVPRVPGSLIFGNLFDFQRDRIALQHRVAREVGDLAELRIGFIPVLMASSPALAHELLVQKNDSFIKSAGLSIFAKPLLGEGLLTSEHDEHKKQRKMMAPLFAHKRIASYAGVMAERAEKMGRELATRQRADVADAMMRVTLEIVGKTLFDAELGGDADDIGDALTDSMTEMMNAMVRLVPLPPSVPTPGNLRMRDAVRRLDEIVYRLIRERRASGIDRGDLLGMLLATKHEDDQSPLSDKEIRDQSMTLMLAGHETTANALSWTLYELARTPDARARVEREIDAAVGKRRVTTDDLKNLPLTLQAIKESMRLHPPAYVIGRQATCEVTLGGVKVPEGRVVLLNVAGMHRRAELFPDPDRFDLDRLSPEREKKLPQLSYMPFGAGPRVCIGNHFALMESHVMLATLMQHVRISLESEREIESEPLVTLRPKGGFQARIAPRIADQSSSRP
ncbi:MAG TPA: cytochrome P450 [Polyangiaceae bacterium]|jgi:cytochrome P450